MDVCDACIYKLGKTKRIEVISRDRTRWERVVIVPDSLSGKRDREVGTWAIWEVNLNERDYDTYSLFGGFIGNTHILVIGRFNTLSFI